MGRGATAAALAMRAWQRRSLRPGWSKCVRTRRCHCLRKWLLGSCCMVGKIDRQLTTPATQPPIPSHISIRMISKSPTSSLS